MNLLRRYIRNILTEAMKAPDTLTSDYAIWTSPEPYLDDPEQIGAGTELDFVLYNIKEAKKYLVSEISQIKNNITEFYEKDDDMDKDDIKEKVEEELENAAGESILSAINVATMAVMRVKTPDGDNGNCNYAWEVVRSAAKKGFGPSIYELIMSIAPHGLSSDRDATSSAARNVWNKYAFERPDVQKKYLDSSYEQITDNPDDDCQLVGGGRRNDPIRFAMMQLFSEWLEGYDQLMSTTFAQTYLKDYTKTSGRIKDPDVILDEMLMEMEYNADELEEELGKSPGAVYQHMLDQWQEYKDENEHELFDMYPPENTGAVELNLSYDVDSSNTAFNHMQINHSEFLTFAEDEGLTGVSEDYGEDIMYSVNGFFAAKYVLTQI